MPNYVKMVYFQSNIKKALSNRAFELGGGVLAPHGLKFIKKQPLPSRR